MNVLFRLCGATLASAAGLLASGCGKTSTAPAWSQINADVANSGQSFGGAIAKQSSATAIIGRVDSSSPVLALDGSVYVGTSTGSDKIPSGELVHLSGDSLAVLGKVKLDGILSTPAVDQNGHVYVAQMKTDGTGGHLLAFSADLKTPPIFDIALTNTKTVSSPKILADPSGGCLIFEACTGSFTHLIIANEKGQTLKDDEICAVVEGGGEPGFQIGGIIIPSVSDPSVGIRLVNGQYYLVLPANRCAVMFYLLTLGNTSADVPGLRPLGSADSGDGNEKYYGSPAISLDGTALINDSDRNFTAYDITNGNQKWQHAMAGDLYTSPVLMTSGGLKAYSVSKQFLTKIDIATGQVEGEVEIAGPTQASPAVGGSYLYISTISGLFTYDLNLTLLAFSPLQGGYSSPALGSAGQIYIGATDKQFYLFPGF
ncbi:MAG: PQQ-like beta-propeller repeat protein [Candidatus Eremiobacteraeota bacterium]|nr:PQQ-like beta-propeller repeat protein [Candidatus Eremiobacteraeota bacterium]